MNIENKENTENIEYIEENEAFIFFKEVSLIDKYNFYEYLSVMIDGGISIIESLESVESKIVSVYLKKKIKELTIYISSGDSLSKGMKKMPDLFSNSEVSIIEAGETIGMLSESLMKLSDDLKKVHTLRNKIKGALTYPTIIFAFLFLAINIVMIYVIPEIKPLFENSDTELPIATKALIFTSDFIVNNVGLILLLIASFIVFIVGFKNTVSGRKSIEGFLLGLPLVGKVYRNYILSNIASSLGNLMGSGINIIKTLKLVSKSTNNSIYEGLFEEVIIDVSSGSKIVDSMSRVDPYKEYFPADYLQMLSVGERTANIDSICKKLNSQYEKEVDYSLASLTKWIEPLAILIAGIFVLWFAFAIFGAILKVSQSVG